MNPLLLEKPMTARADFTPVRAVPDGEGAAVACLEAPFRPSLESQLSFLVNGFWLIGRHRILEWDGRDGRVAEGLRARGHAVTDTSVPAAGAFDRAMFLSRALGHGSDGDPSAWLKAMHRALRPGGLLLFHVLDRDRVRDLVRDFTSREGAAGIAFDPRTGEVTVRRTRQAVRAFNLGEVQALLAGAGFVLERAYGGWEGGSVEEEGEATGRILVVASKPRRRARVLRAIGSAGRGLRRKRAGGGKGGGP